MGTPFNQLAISQTNGKMNKTLVTSRVREASQPYNIIHQVHRGISNLKLSEKLWDEHDILEEKDSPFFPATIFQYLPGFVIDESDKDLLSLEKFEKIKKEAIEKIKKEALEKIKKKSLECSKEYRGKLDCGNLIKQRFWFEVTYIHHLIYRSMPDYTESCRATNTKLVKFVFGRYSDDSQHYDKYKQHKEYENIHKKTTQLLQSCSLNPDLEEIKKETIRNDYNWLLHKVQNTCREINHVKDNDEINNIVDEFLDYIEANKDKYQPELKKHKIWTVRGFLSFFNEITVTDQFNKDGKLHSIVLQIFLPLFDTISSDIVQKRMIGVILWIDDFYEDWWGREKFSENIIDNVLRAVFDSEIDVLDPEKREQITEIRKTRSSRSNNKGLTTETKFRHRNFFSERFALILTECTDPDSVKKIRAGYEKRLILEILMLMSDNSITHHLGREEEMIIN